MKRSACSLFSDMYRGVSPRHPVHMGEQASASSCAGAIACRRAGGYKSWRGWTSSQRFSLVRRAASASLGVGTPPRRRALGSETRKRDREVPRHEDGILLKDSSVEYLVLQTCENRASECVSLPRGKHAPKSRKIR